MAELSSSVAASVFCSYALAVCVPLVLTASLEQAASLFMPPEWSPHITSMTSNSMLALFMLPNVSGCQTQFCSKPFNLSGSRQAWPHLGHTSREMAPTCLGTQKQANRFRVRNILSLAFLFGGSPPNIYTSVCHCVWGLLTAEASKQLQAQRGEQTVNLALRFRAV